MRRFYFYKKFKYLEFLNNLIAKANENQEFSIFLHQVGDFGYNLDFKLHHEDLWRNRVVSILNNGLSVDSYASICGTVKFIGSSKNVDVNKILNYHFDADVSRNAVCIFLIPKYINVNGALVEFSSYNGQSADQRPKDLEQRYRQIDFMVEDRDFMCSLLDCIKKDNLPKEFLLGIQIINNENNNVKFIDPQTHLIYKNLEEQHIFEQALVKGVKDLYKKFGTEQNLEIISKSYQAEKTWIQSRNELEI